MKFRFGGNGSVSAGNNANYIALFFISALLLSPFGMNWLLVFGGNYYPELLLIPLLFVFRRLVIQEFRGAIDCKWFVPLFCYLIVISFVGAFSHGNLIAVYADFRAFLFLMIAALYFSNKNMLIRVQRDKILWNLSLFSIVFYILYFIFGAKTDSVKFSYAFTAFFGIALLAGDKKFSITHVGVVAAIIFSAITSFYRQYWILSALLIIAIMATPFRSIYKIKKSLIWVVGLAFGVIFIIYFSQAVSDQVLNYFNSSESRSIQSIKKFENLVGTLNGTEAGEGDDIRSGYVTFIGGHLVEFLLPSGLGHTAMPTLKPFFTNEYYRNIDVLPSRDGGYIYIIFHFGLFFMLFIGCVFFGRIFLNFFWRHGVIGGRFIYFIVSICSVFIFLTNGQIFSVTTYAFYYGATLALLMRKTL